MKLMVLIAGVHDPKWPIAPQAAFEAAPDRTIMSPFDQAALEMALRVRDANPAAEIAVRVAGGTSGMKVARAVAALRIEDIATFDVERPWDQAATARALASLCVGGYDLVLVGREFGDCDDGLVPAILAAVLGLPLFARAQTIAIQDGISLMREVGEQSETLLLDTPLVASVTNDRRTQLRKPLMKNVMMARQAEIGGCSVAQLATPGLTLASIGPAVAKSTERNCTLLYGSPQQQAAALAELLWEQRA